MTLKANGTFGNTLITGDHDPFLILKEVMTRCYREVTTQSVALVAIHHHSKQQKNLSEMSDLKEHRGQNKFWSESGRTCVTPIHENTFHPPHTCCHTVMICICTYIQSHNNLLKGFNSCVLGWRANIYQHNS